jgi:hypothetical protein
MACPAQKRERERPILIPFLVDFHGRNNGIYISRSQADHQPPREK